MIRVLPLVSFPLIYFVGGEKTEDVKWVAIGVLIFFVILLLMIVVAVFKTGAENPGTLEKVTRYILILLHDFSSLKSISMAKMTYPH